MGSPSLPGCAVRRCSRCNPFQVCSLEHSRTERCAVDTVNAFLRENIGPLIYRLARNAERIGEVFRRSEQFDSFVFRHSLCIVSMLTANDKHTFVKNV